MFGLNKQKSLNKRKQKILTEIEDCLTKMVEHNLEVQSSSEPLLENMVTETELVEIAKDVVKQNSIELPSTDIEISR